MSNFVYAMAFDKRLVKKISTHYLHLFAIADNSVCAHSTVLRIVSYTERLLLICVTSVTLPIFISPQ